MLGFKHTNTITQRHSKEREANHPKLIALMLASLLLGLYVGNVTTKKALPAKSHDHRMLWHQWYAFVWQLDSENYFKGGNFNVKKWEDFVALFKSRSFVDLSKTYPEYREFAQSKCGATMKIPRGYTGDDSESWPLTRDDFIKCVDKC